MTEPGSPSWIRNYVDVIEVARGRKLSRIDVPNAILLAARFSPDGQSLATAYRIRMNGGQSMIKATVWDAASGREDHAGRPRS